MAIDIVEPALYCGVLLCAVLFVFSRIVRRTRRFLLRLSVAGLSVFLLIYVWFYRIKEITTYWGVGRGDPVSMYSLGRARLNYHQGTRFDPKSAYELLSAAANKGYVPAQLKLAARHVTGVCMPRDDDKALLWARKALSQGSEEGALMVRCLESHFGEKCNSLFSKWTYE